MSLLTQQPREVYRIYDEQEYLAGAADLASLEHEPQNIRLRGSAVAAAVLLAAGCASAALIAAQTSRAPSTRTATGGHGRTPSVQRNRGNAARGRSGSRAREVGSAQTRLAHVTAILGARTLGSRREAGPGRGHEWLDRYENSTGGQAGLLVQLQRSIGLERALDVDFHGTH